MRQSSRSIPRRPLRLAVYCAGIAALVVAACRDGGVTTPNNSNAITEWRAGTASTSASTPCTPMTVAQLNSLSDVVFGGGGPNSNSVKSKIDQVDKAMKKNDHTKANSAAFDANRFILQKFHGPQPLAGTSAQVGQLMSGIFCLAGINITVPDPANANIVDPSQTTTIVKSSDSTAGTKLPPGSITEPTVLQFTKVPNSFTTPGAGPLNTRLDQYPGFFLVSAGNAGGSGPATPVIVAICPDASVPASVRARLRLGHEKTSGFEIAPSADASFLTCPAPTNLGFVPKLIDRVLSHLAPKTLYAAWKRQDDAFRGGVGGTASEFSPFDPIDPDLRVAGGVGGTASEFTITPGKPATINPLTGGSKPSGAAATLSAAGVGPAFTASGGVCTANETFWSSPLEPECRPRVTVKTPLGTVMRNVPVTWAVTAGGGTIAAEVTSTRACGTFGANAPDATDANGIARICWTLGADLGTNTTTATVAVGGDAPAGVIFDNVTTTFNATAIKVTPVVALSCPDSSTYTGAAQTPCTNTVTDSVHTIALGSVPVVYGPTTPPLAAGVYTVDASYPGAAKYNAANAPQKTFKIVKAVSATTVSCPASVPFSGSAQTPCTATVTGAGGLNAPVTPVNYANNTSPGTASATATFAGDDNHFGSNGNANFTITAPPVTWNASGPGTVTLLSDGSTGNPSMSYSLSGSVVWSNQTWTLSTTASAAGTFTFAFSHSGYHAFFNVEEFAKPFVIHGAVKTYLSGAVHQGPENCCTPPSGGFLAVGSATFVVSAGDTYGWEFGGRNFDSDARLIATFTVIPQPAYVNMGYLGGGHNCWHDITISVVDASTLKWTNSCNPTISWLMHATANPNFYSSGTDYPYYGTAADVGFTVTRGVGGVILTTTGPSGEIYTKVP